jgi:hypothetical protein
VRASIDDAVLAFPWDEWSIKSYYWDVSQVLFDRLNALSDDASMALTLAIGEWVVHRFDAVNSDPTALQFIEAAWAGTVHPYYCIYTETVDDEWRGPVRGPLAVTMAIANDALFCRENDPEVATRACWMHRLATHVLTDSQEFLKWFETVVQRMEAFHPRAAKERPTFFGLSLASTTPVPRAAFDVSREYDAAQAAGMVDEFLRNLDPAANRFLRPPRDLVGIEEFPGEPYRFSAGVPG